MTELKEISIMEAHNRLLSWAKRNGYVIKTKDPQFPLINDAEFIGGKSMDDVGDYFVIYEKSHGQKVEITRGNISEVLDDYLLLKKDEKIETSLIYYANDYKHRPSTINPIYNRR